MGRQVTIVAVRRVLGRRARKGGIVKGVQRPQQSVGGGAGIRPAPELGAVPPFPRHSALDSPTAETGTCLPISLPLTNATPSLLPTFKKNFPPHFLALPIPL